MFWDFFLYFVNFGIGCGVVLYVIKLLNGIQSQNKGRKVSTKSGSGMNEQEDLFYHSVFANDRTDIFKPGK